MAVQGKAQNEDAVVLLLQVCCLGQNLVKSHDAWDTTSTTAKDEMPTDGC